MRGGGLTKLRGGVLFGYVQRSKTSQPQSTTHECSSLCPSQPNLGLGHSVGPIPITNCFISACLPTEHSSIGLCDATCLVSLPCIASHQPISSLQCMCLWVCWQTSATLRGRFAVECSCVGVRKIRKFLQSKCAGWPNPLGWLIPTPCDSFYATSITRNNP